MSSRCPAVSQHAQELCCALHSPCSLVVLVDCCRFPHWSVARQSSSSITQVRAQIPNPQTAATQQLSPQLAQPIVVTWQAPLHPLAYNTHCDLQLIMALCPPPLRICRASCVLQLHTVCTSPNSVTTRAQPAQSRLPNFWLVSCPPPMAITQPFHTHAPLSALTLPHPAAWPPPAPAPRPLPFLPLCLLACRRQQGDAARAPGGVRCPWLRHCGDRLQVPRCSRQGPRRHGDACILRGRAGQVSSHLVCV